MSQRIKDYPRAGCRPSPKDHRIGSLIPAQTPLERLHGVQRYRDHSRRNTTRESLTFSMQLVSICSVSYTGNPLTFAIDPEVSALSSITNIQNSLFVPSLGKWVKRRPTFDLDQIPRPLRATTPPETEEARRRDEEAERPDAGGRRISLQSILVEPNYAVLPHGVSLDGWSQEDVAELNDYVRHMLHSRRSRFKRNMKAFGKYVRKPLGFFVTLYATLITLFGLAWVLFLIGWIYVGEKQLYMINVIDYVLVALFAIVGDGLAPFRAVDTYHMIYIAHYREFSFLLLCPVISRINLTSCLPHLDRLTWKLRKQKSLPKLENKNDLPTESTEPTLAANAVDLEAAHRESDRELSVLTPKQQARLEHHQAKFSRSHTFYKPHETETHYAFPNNLLIAIVVLLDLHSCLQISLGACTWGIDYRVRPMALTATILSCSIAVNITAGVLISLGGRRTRKRDVVERMFRQELTEEALHRMRDARSGAEDENVTKIDEAIDEADENKEKDEEKENKGLNLPRPSLDAWRGRHGDSRSGKSKDGGRMLSPGKKTAQEVGRFDAHMRHDDEEKIPTI